MRLLLDSHALLWALASPEKLAARAAREISDPSNAVFFSAVSAWELEIKRERGKLIFPDDWSCAAKESGFLELAVTSEHAMRAARLPMHHRDPFDRMLIAQSLCEDLRLVTRDRSAARYGASMLEA